MKNALIMSAGLSSRFAPLSYEKPKALVKVKGEILIERQIKQLKEAGINDIAVIVGYKKEQLFYLKEKYNVKIIINDEYLTKNNVSSIYAARDFIKDTYICSSDNYFNKNPFLYENNDSYYSVKYSKGHTDEWCVKEDEASNITEVNIGGSDSWYMMGEAFWNEEFSKKFLKILEEEYNNPNTYNKLWEHIYIEHIDELNMKTKKCNENDVFEFDSIDELRTFDSTYIYDTGSSILKSISDKLCCSECDMTDFRVLKDANETVGFTFTAKNKNYRFNYAKSFLEEF